MSNHIFSSPDTQLSNNKSNLNYAIIPSYSAFNYAYHINTCTYAYTCWLYLHTQIWNTAGNKWIGIYVLMAGDKRKEKQSTALLNGILCEGHKTGLNNTPANTVNKHTNLHIASHLLYKHIKDYCNHFCPMNFVFIVLNS